MESPVDPMISIWFGNFFEPFLTDQQAIAAGIREVRDLGFNNINLDSKAWEDFFARYRGEEASPYVAMQEFMMQQAIGEGLSYTHLALYLSGDNLYPHIRDAAPVRGEDATGVDGQSLKTYKYWSPHARRTMQEHVQGLLRLYARGMRHTRRGRGGVVMQTMFEPIVKPSFDPEGRQRYLAWLGRRYDHDINRLNAAYNLTAKSFDDLQPHDYWLRPEELSWVSCAVPTATDFAGRTPDFRRWIDNQTYLRDELVDYLRWAQETWRAMCPAIFIEPVLHQWGYFFNPPGHSMWQTGLRALDVYRCAPYVDGTLFIAAPLNAENRADAYALSVEAAIMRCANSDRSFTGGLYLGRHVNGDIYSCVTPAEAIGTLIAHGASSLYVYGYSGFDDGGVLCRMDASFKTSLRAGNEWARRVIPLITSSRQRDSAILFPAEMSLFEPLELDEGGRHRMDMLGWFRQLTDLGWHVDILHPEQIASGILRYYRHLIIPHQELYDLGDHGVLESAVGQFVAAGGTVLHGPHCRLIERISNVREQTVSFDCIAWREALIPHGWSTVAFSGGTPEATYIQSGQTAIMETSLGRGRIISFGFQYGYAYSRCTMPVPPAHYGRREMHPIILLRQTPVEVFIGRSPHAPIVPLRGVEAARFGRHALIVNHRSEPVELPACSYRQIIRQMPSDDGTLPGHSAVCVELI